LDHFLFFFEIDRFIIGARISLKKIIGARNGWLYAR